MTSDAAQTTDASDGEIYDHCAAYINQLSGLAQALQLALDAETNAPLKAEVPGSLALAIERAAEDARSAFEAHYHPGPKPEDTAA